MRHKQGLQEEGESAMHSATHAAAPEPALSALDADPRTPYAAEIATAAIEWVSWAFFRPRPHYPAHSGAEFGDQLADLD
jgi:hypothetical protein